MAGLSLSVQRAQIIKVSQCAEMLQVIRNKGALALCLSVQLVPKNFEHISRVVEISWLKGPYVLS